MAPGPFGVLSNATVSINATQYAAKVKTALFTPSTNVSTYPVLAPVGNIQDVDQPVWTLQLVGVQDWSTAGISKYLNDNRGTEVPVIVTPEDTTGWPTCTATVIAMAPPFGGTSGEWAEYDLTLPVVGQPTFGVKP
jgi:hypothetical protein